MPFTMYGGELKELAVKEEPITAEMYNQICQAIKKPIRVSDIKLWDIKEEIDGQSIYYLDAILEEHFEEEHSKVESVEISNCALILSATTQVNFIQNMRQIRRLYLSTGYKNNESNYLGIEQYEKIIQDNLRLNSLDLWLDVDEMGRLIPAINSCTALKQLKIMGTPENISLCCAELKKNQSIEALWVKSADVIIDVDEATAFLDLIRHNQYIKYLNLSELCLLTIPAAEMFIAFLKDNHQLMIDYYALEADEKLAEKTANKFAFYNSRNLFISKVSSELEEALSIFQRKTPGLLQQVFEHIDKAFKYASNNQDVRFCEEAQTQYSRCKSFQEEIYAQLQEERHKVILLCQENAQLKNELTKVNVKERLHSDSSVLEAMYAMLERKTKKQKLNEEESKTQKQEVTPGELFSNDYD